jgi:hypothetical protein
MTKTSRRASLSALARLPLQNALTRVLRLTLPAPVQRFARDALRRVLRDFPLVAELLELARVVRSGGGDAGVVTGTATETDSATETETDSATDSDSATETDSATDSDSDSASVSGSVSDSGAGIEALLGELRGPSAERAAAAVERLALSKDPRARAALLAVVRNQDGYLHPLPRVAALRALAADGDGAARTAIVAAVGGVSAELSLAAIAALVQYAPESAADPIRRVVDDRSGYFAPEVRMAAERALRQLPDRIVPGQN